MGHHRVGQVVRGEVGRHRGAERVPVRRVAADADEDVAAHAAAVHGLQPELRLVDLALHVTGAGERAVEVVGPLVIRAHEALRAAVVRRADARAPVAAGIVEGADRAVVAPYDHDRVLADLQREELPGLLDLAIVAGEQPVAMMDVLEVEPEEGGVAVEVARQRIARAVRVDLGQHGLMGAHGGSHEGPRVGAGGIDGDISLSAPRARALLQPRHSGPRATRPRRRASDPPTRREAPRRCGRTGSAGFEPASAPPVPGRAGRPRHQDCLIPSDENADAFSPSHAARAAARIRACQRSREMTAGIRGRSRPRGPASAARRRPGRRSRSRPWRACAASSAARRSCRAG